MTIKIIQHGRYYEPPSTANCRNCRCIFSFDKGDVKVKEVGGDYDVYPAVTCPECGWDIEIDEDH